MSEFKTIGEAAPAEGKMQVFESDGNRVAVANSDGTLYAFDDTCTHLGCSLTQGRLEGTRVTCRCHGSQFNVTSGEVLHGPAVRPIRTYRVRVERGALQLAV